MDTEDKIRHAKIAAAIEPDASPIIYYDNESNFHREGGPAYETNGGYKSWFIHGKRHRTDGPAIEYPNGDVEWFYNDQPAPVKTQKEFESWIRNKAFW
jgi:hypothetical protein